MLQKRIGYLKIGLVCILIFLSFMGVLHGLNKKDNYGDNPPQISGKMVYHTYLNYSDGDSQIYLFDFKTKENICLSNKFKNVFNEMNADLSKDGTKIVFMGMINNKGKEEWDIFTYNLESEELINLTKGNVLSDEDPKFSPDDRKIVFKQGYFNDELGKVVYDIKEMDLITKDLKVITDDIEEDSMPFYSSDGESVYYSRKTGNKASEIYKTNLYNINQIKKIYKENGITCYYPTVYNSTLYFTKDYSRTNSLDVIVKMDFNTNEITIPDFNSPDFDCSDAYAISDEFIIISSTMPGGKGGYDLYIADVITGKTWSLDIWKSGINDDKNQLGASYYAELTE